MKSLFPLPAPKRIVVTRARLKLLDRIEMGRPLPRSISRQVLRRLIKDELIVVTLGRPAVYRLTPVGRMVRSRPRYPERNKLPNPGGRNESGRATAAAE